MKLWHCHDARSLRALWALEEMNLEYDLEVMPFPPRFLHEGYLDINVLGTVPHFKDGDVHMTESTAICHYLIEKYKKRYKNKSQEEYLNLKRYQVLFYLKNFEELSAELNNKLKIYSIASNY